MSALLATLMVIGFFVWAARRPRDADDLRLMSPKHRERYLARMQPVPVRRRPSPLDGAE